MARVFFTSDLHFDHENLCRGLRNMSAKESNEIIIENWNRVVTKRDLVYILGDVTMENHKNIEYFMNRLQGSKVVIGGNHDDLRCYKEYMYLGIPVMGVLKYKGFLCTHMPVHVKELEYYRGNIHGHLHNSGYIEGVGFYDAPIYNGRYYNVNTEYHNYTPVLFSNIEEYFIMNNDG